MNTHPLSLKTIKAIMKEPDKSPCVITPREQQPPSSSEETEVYGRNTDSARRDYDSGTDHDDL